MRNSRYTLLYIIVLAATILTACDRQTVYSHYEHTPIAGWERNDSLSFDIPATGAAACLQEEVGLRISGDYPFMAVTLIVEQTVLPGKQARRDTLVCQLTDEKGWLTGQGVSQYQYRYALKTVALDKGDSLHVTIRHNMKREILPGIADVGFILRTIGATACDWRPGAGR